MMAYKVLVATLWIIAASVSSYHLTWVALRFMPVEHWIQYESVTPVKEVFKVDEKLKFRTHIIKNKNVTVTFHDTLFCRDELGGLERHSSQPTFRLLIPENLEYYAVWPYSPGVSSETECCLKSTGEVHLPLHVDRSISYDGCFNQKFFQVKGE